MFWHIFSACKSVAVHLSECRKLQRAIMCLLSTLYLMLNKPGSGCLSYSLSPPILAVSTGRIPVVQYLLLGRLLLNFSGFPSSRVSSLSQFLRTAALSPNIDCCPSIFWCPEFCWECTLSSHAPALLEAILSVRPHTDPWETPLCTDYQLDSQALWILAVQSILYLPRCPPLQLSLTNRVTRQLWETVPKAFLGVSFSPLRHISHHLMNLCVSKWAEQSIQFSSSAVGTASLPQEKLEGSTAFKAERKLMNPPKCYADFHNDMFPSYLNSLTWKWVFIYQLLFRKTRFLSLHFLCLFHHKQLLASCCLLSYKYYK